MRKKGYVEHVKIRASAYCRGMEISVCNFGFMEKMIGFYLAYLFIHNNLILATIFS